MRARDRRHAGRSTLPAPMRTSGPTIEYGADLDVGGELGRWRRRSRSDGRSATAHRFGASRRRSSADSAASWPRRPARARRTALAARRPAAICDSSIELVAGNDLPLEAARRRCRRTTIAGAPSASPMPLATASTPESCVERLEHQHAGHHRIAGKVALEVRLVHRDVLDRRGCDWPGDALERCGRPAAPDSDAASCVDDRLDVERSRRDDPHFAALPRAPVESRARSAATRSRQLRAAGAAATPPCATARCGKRRKHAGVDARPRRACGRSNVPPETTVSSGIVEVAGDHRRAADPAVAADAHAAGDADAAGDRRVRADHAVVADLDLVVELDVVLDHRVVDRAAVDRRVGADLAVGADDDAAELRDLAAIARPPPPCRSRRRRSRRRRGRSCARRSTQRG